jgi:hypothetical protein
MGLQRIILMSLGSSHGVSADISLKDYKGFIADIEF